jgi:hypothetical protein
MARLTRVGWFCTAGQTELEMGRFLEKIDPSATWIRCFPIKQKPGPKYIPRASREGGRPLVMDGTTGDQLVARIRDRIEGHGLGPLDAILVLDDADCRFCGRGAEATLEWTAGLSAALPGTPPVFALLASPEIEAWFLADHENGFERWYTDVPSLRARLGDMVGRNPPWRDVERYGCPRVDNSCSTKLSEELIRGLANGPAPRRYSKASDGAEMLARIVPGNVARACDTYFAPELKRMSGFLRGARP